MKQALAVSLFLLLAVTGASDNLHAQSGRRIAQSPGSSAPVSSSSTGKSSSSANSSSSSADDGDVVDQGVVEQGETVEGDVVRVNTSLVTVPVTVRDRDGKYIPNLGRTDFHIFEDGVEQRVAYFATVDKPFNVVLLIDTSRSTDFRLEDIQDAAIAFVNQLKPEDKVTVISFDEDINVLARATSNREELVRAIRRTRTGSSTRLYDAVDQVIRRELKGGDGRKAVVLFTDGVDTTSRTTYERTVREAEECDALFYPVAYSTSGSIPHGSWPSPSWPRGGGGGMGWPFPRGGGMPGGGGGRGPGSSPEDYRLADAYLHDLARVSGGQFYRGDSLQNISESFAQIAEELRRQYSLGYYPKQTAQQGQRHQIKVRVDQPGLVVQARDSYIYSQKNADPNQPKDPQPAKPESPKTNLSDTR